MPNKKIEFVRSRGVGLTVRLELPSVHAGASALFAHCFAGGKDRAAAMLAAKYRVPEVRAVATTGAPTDPDLTTVGLRRAGPTARLSGRHGTDTPSRRRFIDGDVARGTGSAE